MAEEKRNTGGGRKPHVFPTGTRVGRLTVVGRVYRGGATHSLFECRCDCGVTTVVCGTSLKRGSTQSCGCLFRERSAERARRRIRKRGSDNASFKDVAGRRYGRLVAIEPVFGGRQTVWRCACDCGGEHSTGIDQLTSGNCRSCGCLADEARAAANLTHGMSRRPEHGIWLNMRRRCSDAAVGADRRNYFERGIRVCERWEDFASFYADMGQRPSSRHSIERLNNDMGYEPGNCVWETRTAQARNTRRTKYATVNGETLPVAVFAERHGVPVRRVYDRLRRGWSAEEALELHQRTTVMTEVRPGGAVRMSPPAKVIRNRP